MYYCRILLLLVVSQVSIARLDEPTTGETITSRENEVSSRGGDRNNDRYPIREHQPLGSGDVGPDNHTTHHNSSESDNGPEHHHHRPSSRPSSSRDHGVDGSGQSRPRHHHGPGSQEHGKGSRPRHHHGSGLQEHGKGSRPRPNHDSESQEHGRGSRSRYHGRTKPKYETTTILDVINVNVF